MSSRFLLHLAVVPLCFACGEPETTTSCPQVDASTWLDKEPEAYVYRTCGTGFLPSACSIIVIRNGSVIATSDGDEDDGVAPLEPSEATSLTRAFDHLDCAGCERRVTVDQEWGYVSEVYFDCGEEGYGAEVTCFAADTTDPNACP